jgi:acyl carrier protein
MMTEATGKVERAVRDALLAVCPEAGAVDGNANLTNELGMDSVQVMDFIMEIEDRLDISIPIATIGEARTLNQLCAGIRRLTDLT